MNPTDDTRTPRAGAAPTRALLLSLLLFSMAVGCVPGDAAQPAGTSAASASIEGHWQMTEQLTGPECSGGGGLIQYLVTISQTEGSSDITVDSGRGPLHGTLQRDHASWTGEVPWVNRTYLTVTSLDVEVDGDTFAGASTWIVRDGMGGPEICSGDSSLSAERLGPLAPEAPSDLRITIDGPSAHLTWRDNSDDETGFVVHVTDLSQYGTAGDFPLGPNEESATITPVRDGVLYSFSVSAENEGGSSSTSTRFAMKDGEPRIPAAPTRLDAENLYQTAAHLSWVDEATDETSYRVYRSRNPTVVGEVVSDTLPDSTVYIDGMLEPESAYYYHVSAVNGAGESLLAGPVEVVTERDLAGPWNLTGRATLEPQKSGACSLVADDFDEPAVVTRIAFDRIEIRSRSFELLAILNGHGRADIWGTAFGGSWVVDSDTSRLRTGGDGTTMAANFDISTSACAASVSLGFAVGSAPLAPDGFAVRSVGARAVTLEWEDRSDNEAGFEISRSTHAVGNALGNATGPLQVVARLGVGATAWTDYDVEPGTFHHYYVGAFNGAGYSPLRSLTVKTLLEGVDPPESAPFDVQAEALSSSAVEVSWSDASDDEVGFQILRGIEAGNMASVGQVGRDVTRFIDTRAAPDTQYYYTVWAFNGGGVADEGNIASVRTPPEVALEAPTPLRATVTGPTSVWLDWSDNALNEDGYQIFMARDVCSIAMSWLRSVPADSESEQITGLAPGTYCFAVVAYSGGETSARSNPAYATLVAGGTQALGDELQVAEGFAGE